MDIRGIEVTNQLRSAIRAKLLELGVRYDEELPDYILVMVVNKKSRQQMHEDLHLFLENNTAPFVDWLHDQVLKKLQKVTIAKKKVSREFVPSVIIKQEEERKKHKTTTSFLDDHNTKDVTKKLLGKPLKEDKDAENVETKSEFPSESNQEENSEKNIDKTESKEKTPVSTNESDSGTGKKVTSPEPSSSKSKELSKSNKPQTEPKNSKPTNETVNHSQVNTSTDSGKRSRNSNEEEDASDSKKVKSSIIKPKITSVVSVKNRIGIVSLKRKSDSHADKEISFNRHKHERITTISKDERPHERPHEHTDRRSNFPRSKNAEFNDDSRMIRNFDSKTRDKTIDVKNRLGNFRDNNKSSVNHETREKIPEKSGSTIKNRLGSSGSNRVSLQSSSKKQEIPDERRMDRHERSSFRGKNVKYRLGPMRKTFRPDDTRNVNFQESRHLNIRNLNHKDRNSFKISTRSGKDGNFSNVPFENDTDDDNDDDDDDGEADVNVAPVKSHIVAVQKPSLEKSSRKQLKSSDEDEEQVKDCKVPSKVIVTPRPLKPLPSTQKRATQSLLLRAVAEANQSVVSQKNPEPSLVEAKPPLKRPKSSGSWTGGQNLSVHLDSQKRYVMENIQIELTTVTNNDTKHYESQEVTDEHIGVVRSLFQQSDNNQKFLVTLNGYNNNLPQEKSSDENEENLDTEVNECDEQEESVDNSNTYPENESNVIAFRVSNNDDDDDDDESSNSKQSNNDENQNTENINEVEEPPKKSRKLSPIVYNKSRSPTPEISTTKAPVSSVIINTEKKSKIDSVSVSLNSLIDEKCRYWPNCTLGKKCAYIHPDVLCSLFPACKFGANCQYLHPRCKFGLSCTKVGCIFSHPPEKCKYHPYCTNPSCSYSHPSVVKPTLLSQTTRRAKFTWRRQN